MDQDTAGSSNAGSFLGAREGTQQIDIPNSLRGRGAAASRYTREEQNFLIWAGGNPKKFGDDWQKKAKALHIWLGEIHPEVAKSTPFRKPKALRDQWDRRLKPRISNLGGKRDESDDEDAWKDTAQDRATREDLNKFFCFGSKVVPQPGSRLSIDKMSEHWYAIHESEVIISPEERLFMGR